MTQLSKILGLSHPPSYWRDRFDAWKRPPSDNEETKINRTAETIKNALKENEFLADLDLRVFGQGSYQNNTNVRLNSDMDICVLWKRKVSIGNPSGENFTLSELGLFPLDEPLEHLFDQFKDAIHTALIDEFGWLDVSRGNKSIQVESERDTIINSDIVPAVMHWNIHRRTDWKGTTPKKDLGILIIADDQSKIRNFPDQHNANGIAKNKRTGMRYKQVVRILKKLQNYINDDQLFYEPVASFLIECLAYSCHDKQFRGDDIFEVVSNVLRSIDQITADDLLASSLYEVNFIKPLFTDDQPWQRSEANYFARVALDTIGA